METLRMSSVVSPNVEYVLCVPPMVCGLQLLAAIRFSLFDLGCGVQERLVYRSPLPGVGKPAIVVVRVQGPRPSSRQSSRSRSYSRFGHVIVVKP